MKRLLIALGLASAAVHTCMAQDTAASAPADAHSKAVQRALPVESRAIGATEGAQAPGDVHPERRVRPQIAVPLTPSGRIIRGRGQDARVKPAGGGIDDRAARCRALQTQAERDTCQSALKEGESKLR